LFAPRLQDEERRVRAVVDSVEHVDASNVGEDVHNMESDIASIATT
jgi:hypothetical protein